MGRSVDSLVMACFLGSLIGLMKLQDFLFHKDMAFSSLRSPPSPNVYDSIYESLCKPWLGNCICVVECGIHVDYCYYDDVECILVEPCFHWCGGGLFEA